MKAVSPFELSGSTSQRRGVTFKKTGIPNYTAVKNLKILIKVIINYNFRNLSRGFTKNVGQIRRKIFYVEIF